MGLDVGKSQRKPSKAGDGDTQAADEVGDEHNDRAGTTDTSFSLLASAARMFPLELMGMELNPKSLASAAAQDGWFDPVYYAETYTVVSDDLFTHFCRIGAFFGASPNAQTHHAVKRLAGKRLNAHEAAAPDDPAAHPFDAGWYSHLYLAVAGISLDAWEHYAVLGHARGYARNPAENEGLPPTRAYVRKPGSAPTFSLTSIGRKSAPRGISSKDISRTAFMDAEDLQPFMDSLSQTLDELLEPDGGNGWGFLEPQADLYFNAELVDTMYGDALGAQADFASYLESGYPKGLYPNLATAIYDGCALRHSGKIETASRFSALGRRTASKDDIRTKVLKSPLAASEATAKTDATLLADFRRRLANDLFDPDSYLGSARNTVGHVSSLPELKALQHELTSGSLFDAERYAADFDVALTSDQIDAFYLLAGQTLGHEATPGFDRLYYTETYPDIVDNRIAPHIHYERHGREEGRASLGGEAVGSMTGRRRFYKSRPTLLVFSHEASLSGAPIVALNIAKGLSKRYNVVAWLGSSGPLDAEFAAVCTDVRIGWSSAANFAEALDDLRERHMLRAAFVNSIVCHPVLPRLKASSLPVIGIVHEFANYVYPSGTTSRGAMLTEASVYPARIVSDAVKLELQRHGTPVPETVLVRHQGYNSTGGKTSDLSTDDILSKIKAGKNPVVVLGAGHVEARKGVDLFLQTAQRCRLLSPDTNWKFIWVGGGFDPLTDLNFSLYLDMQIRLNGLEEVVTLFGHQPTLAPFWDVADIFFLSSRLDPFPNVVLDALNAKVPVVCFDDATGFEDIIESHPHAVASVPFLDCHGAAESIIDISGRLEEIAERYHDPKNSKDLAERLSFESYVSYLEAVVEAALPSHQLFETIRNILDRTSLRRIRSLTRRVPAFLFPAKDGYSRAQMTARLAAFFSSYVVSPYALEEDFPEILEPSSLCKAAHEFSDPLQRVRDTSILLYAETAGQIDEFVRFFDLSRHDITAIVRAAGSSVSMGDLRTHPNVISAAVAELPAMNAQNVLIADLSGLEDIPSLNDPLSTVVLGLLSGRYDTVMDQRYKPSAIIPVDYTVPDQTALPVCTDRMTGYYDREALIAALEGEKNSVATSDGAIARIHSVIRGSRKTAIAGAIPAWID